MNDNATQDDRTPESPAETPKRSDGSSNEGDNKKEGTAPNNENSRPWKPARQSRAAIITFSVVIIVGILLVLAAWHLPPFATALQPTEDAYVRGSTTDISPQVSGYVDRVLVKDFAFVSAGQVLLVIDPSTYQQKVEQAQADLDAKNANLANNRQSLAQARAAVDAKDAAIASAQAQAMRTEADMKRSDDLVRDGSVSEREAEQNRAAYKQAVASVQQAKADRESAVQQMRTVEVNEGALMAAVAGSRASLHAAQIDLAHTTIRAPVAGQLSEVGVRAGQYVTNGSQLLFLVPPELWVNANYKEAQTAHMAVGQPAYFTVDALAGARVNGHIERMSPATGAEFAVIKPDNATGNFTKVPQRITVRITVDPGQAIARRLRAGMSVETHVDTSTGPDIAQGEGLAASPDAADTPVSNPPASALPSQQAAQADSVERSNP